MSRDRPKSCFRNIMGKQQTDKKRLIWSTSDHCVLCFGSRVILADTLSITMNPVSAAFMTAGLIARFRFLC